VIGGVVGLTMLGTPALGAQPAPVTVAVSAPAVVSACGLTELPVTVDNRGAARDVVLGLQPVGPQGVPSGRVDFQLASGEWRPLDSNADGPSVRLPENGAVVQHFRLGFVGGDDRSAGSVRVTVRDVNSVALATAETRIVLGAPVVRIERPVRERISTAERLEFGVQVSNPGDVDCPSVLLRIFNGAPIDKYRSGQGMSVEVATDKGPWRPVTVSGSIHSWDGQLDNGSLPRQSRHGYRVRFGSAEQTGNLELQLTASDRTGTVLAMDSATVEVATVPPARPAAFPIWRLITGAAIGAVAVLLILLAVRSRRKRDA
jgi:hypothetical protein